MSIFFVSIPSKAQNFYPDSCTISLLTASPGEELYTTFGHSAIRIVDTERDIDYVYNYGIFNFRTPNFYPKFIKGDLIYWLGAAELDSFLSTYIRENRKVTERVMNLSTQQKSDIIDFLQKNIHPDNREYLYDFFYDNCATRIRDVVENELGEEFEYTHILKREVTFRQLLDEYLVNMPWADFGIDLILGLPADQPANFNNQMFLPDYLESNLSKGLVNGEPLFQEATTILPFQFEPDLSRSFFTPVIVMILLLLVVLLITFLIKQNWVQNCIDLLLFLLLGIMGSVFLFMWLGTNHQACYQNLNMLWANPLYLLIVPFALVKKRKWVWWFILLTTLILLVGFPVFPQQYHLAFVPIFIVIAIRCWYRIKKQ